MNVNGDNGLNKNGMYVIEWRDHFSTEGFYSGDMEEFTDTSLIFRSLGFFIKEDTNYFHFARTIGEEDCADIMSIMKNQIVYIEEIEEE